MPMLLKLIELITKFHEGTGLTRFAAASKKKM